MDFPSLVADLGRLTGSAQVPATAVDRILTLRRSLPCAWIIEHERHGENPPRLPESPARPPGTAMTLLGTTSLVAGIRALLPAARAAAHLGGLP